MNPTLRGIAVVAIACISALSTGFGIGLIVGHPAPFLTATMTNSTVNASLPQGTQSVGFPCSSDYYNTRCVFTNNNESWICNANRTVEKCENVRKV
jgi:hypothetical protein